jgi:hypothetical protein
MEGNRIMTYKRLYEKDLSVIEIDKLKYFPKNALLKLLNNSPYNRLAYDGTKNIVGGVKNQLLLFIKDLIKKDEESTKELGWKLTPEQQEDYKYLKGIK